MLSKIILRIIACLLMSTAIMSGAEKIEPFLEMVDTAESIAIINQGKVERVLRGSEEKAEKLIKDIGKLVGPNRFTSIVFLYNDSNGIKCFANYPIINDMVSPRGVPDITIDKLIERIKAND